ncbi:MAG: hypothetical protein JSW58_15535, partial [Candidatus Latescibacterota bacterium]
MIIRHTIAGHPVMHCGFRRLVMLIVLAFFASGCSGTGRLNIPDPMPDDQRDIPPPKKRKI